VSSTTVQDVDADQGADGSFGYGVALGAAFQIPDLGIASVQSTTTHRVSQELRLRSSAWTTASTTRAACTTPRKTTPTAFPASIPFSTTTGAAYPLPSIVKASIDTSYKEYSLFANATYAITPQFDVLAGIRYGKDDQKYHQDYSGLLVGPAPVLIDSGSKNNKTTYLATARYKPSATDAFYARVATGYRPGGPNAAAADRHRQRPADLPARHPHQL
jgi:iron complex outermembrane receptor protein